MNNKRAQSAKSRRPGAPPPRHGDRAARPGPPTVYARHAARKTEEKTEKTLFEVIERASRSEREVANGLNAKRTGPFRILIAVHRPRFRGRSERAAALVGWEVTSLQNKQDPVGLVAKPPYPPDILILSGDFGRQKTYAIFRAVQEWRKKGMKIIGLVDDCATAPEDFPDSVPSKLCDICLQPPYTAADLRVLLTRLYEEMRGKPAPPPKTAQEAQSEQEEED